MIFVNGDFNLAGFIGASLQIMTERSVYAAERMNEIFLEKLNIILSTPGSGRWYKSKRGDGSRHQASAPGQPPAPDREVYRRSWSGRVVVSGTTVQALIGSDLWEKFGRRLELGGSGGGVYIAPRPHVSVAVQQTEAPFNRLIEGIDR